jgi:hypothetical protein
VEKLFKILGGQKFTCCLVLMAISVIFFAIGKLSESGFVDLLKWSFTSFVLTHAATNVTAIVRGKQ